MRVLDEIWNGKNPPLVLFHAEESSRRILNVNEKIRLTKDVVGTAGFTAGTMVMVHEVRFSPMTPPPGMPEKNYLSAVYKVALFEGYRERQDFGNTIQSDKVPHASLSTRPGEAPSTQVYAKWDELFLVLPFSYKYQGNTVTLPAGTPVKVMDPGAVTKKGSIVKRPELALYNIIQQRIVIKDRVVRVANMPVQKIYFE